MEGTNDWRRPFEYDYFELQEYIDKIKITDDVLGHLADVETAFEQYLQKIKEASGFDKDEDGYALLYTWLDDSINELNASAAIEKHKFLFNSTDLIKGDLFFDNMSMSHERVKKIHQFVCQNSKTNMLNSTSGEYRKGSTRVSVYLPDGTEDIFWYGVKAENIIPFMKNYINYYKERRLLPIYYNPFLKSALAHLLFVRIHPFGDGNGRTARIIHNITFTSEINKFYGTSLKLSPLNISANIKINQLTYVNRINMIKFNMEEETNEEINKWFHFILNMYEEQLYYQTSRLEKIRLQLRTLNLLKDDGNPILKKAAKSKLGKLL